MSGKVAASSVKNRCTEDKKKECEKNGKICNPNSKSNNPKIYCFNDTEKNRSKIEEFEKLQAEKGESLLGFAMQNAQNGGKRGAKQPDMQKLLTAVLSGNANGIKLELVDTLGGAADQMAGMMGQSVIIGDRNKACLKVLIEQTKAGKKKLGIFYGAAHFPDMEKDMLKMGYKKTGHRWLSAWDIPKAVAKPQPKKEPAALPDAA